MILALAWIIVSAPPPGPAVVIEVDDPRLAARLRDELAASGFTLVDAGVDARARVVAVGDAASSVDVWLVVDGEDGRADARSEERIATLPLDADRDVVAVRVAEMLRAELVRMRPRVGPFVSTATVTSTAPAAPPEGIPAVVRASAGLSGLLPLGAVPSTVRMHVRGSALLGCCLEGGLSADVPIAPAQLANTEGAAELTLTQAAVDVGARIPLRDRLDAALGVAAGALWLHGVGSGDRGRTLDGLVGTVAGRAELRVRLLPWLAGFASGEAGLLTQTPQISLGAARPITLGPAWLAASAGLTGSFPFEDEPSGAAPGTQERRSTP